MGTRTSRCGIAAIVALAIGAVAPVAAAPITINFSADAPGAKPNGFSPVGHPGVRFSDSIGANLEVGDFGHQTDGQGLIVRADDASKLAIDFDFEVDYLRIEFGNDDPGFAQPGDIALLQVFEDAVLVGAAQTPLNLDDVLNQFVEFAGGPFNRAEFYFAGPQGNPLGLTEAVDNITYNRVGEIPEPVALALLALGLASLPRRRGGVRA